MRTKLNFSKTETPSKAGGSEISRDKGHSPSRPSVPPPATARSLSADTSSASPSAAPQELATFSADEKNAQKRIKRQHATDNHTPSKATPSSKPPMASATIPSNVSSSLPSPSFTGRTHNPHAYIHPSSVNTHAFVKQFYTEIAFLLHHTVASVAHTVGAAKCVLLAPSGGGSVAGQQRFISHPMAVRGPQLYDTRQGRMRNRKSVMAVSEGEAAGVEATTADNLFSTIAKRYSDAAREKKKKKEKRQQNKKNKREGAGGARRGSLTDGAGGREGADAPSANSDDDEDVGVRAVKVATSSDDDDDDADEDSALHGEECDEEDTSEEDEGDEDLSDDELLVSSRDHRAAKEPAPSSAVINTMQLTTEEGAASPQMLPPDGSSPLPVIDASALRPNKVGPGYVYSSNRGRKPSAGGEGTPPPDSPPTKNTNASPNALSTTNTTAAAAAAGGAVGSSNMVVNNDLAAIAAWCSSSGSSSSSSALPQQQEQQPEDEGEGDGASRNSGSAASQAFSRFLPHDFVAKGEGVSTASLAMRLNLMINCSGQMEPVGCENAANRSTFRNKNSSNGADAGGWSKTMASLRVEANGMSSFPPQSPFSPHPSKVVDETLLPATRKSLHHSALFIPIELDARQCWGESYSDGLLAAASASGGGSAALPQGPIAVIALYNKRDPSAAAKAGKTPSSMPSTAAANNSSDTNGEFTSFSVQDEALALSCVRGAIAPILLRCWNFARAAKISVGAGAGAWGETKTFLSTMGGAVANPSSHGQGHVPSPTTTTTTTATSSNSGSPTAAKRKERHGALQSSAAALSVAPRALMSGGNTHRVAVDVGGRVAQAPPTNYIDYERLRAAFEDDYRPRLLGTDGRARFAVDFLGRSLLSLPIEASSVLTSASKDSSSTVTTAAMSSSSSSPSRRRKRKEGKDEPSSAPLPLFPSSSAAFVPRAMPQLYKSFKPMLITRVGMLPPTEVMQQGYAASLAALPPPFATTPAPTPHPHLHGRLSPPSHPPRDRSATTTPPRRVGHGANNTASRPGTSNSTMGGSATNVSNIVGRVVAGGVGGRGLASCPPTATSSATPSRPATADTTYDFGYVQQMLLLPPMATPMPTMGEPSQGQGRADAVAESRPTTAGSHHHHTNTVVAPLAVGADLCRRHEFLHNHHALSNASSGAAGVSNTARIPLSVGGGIYDPHLAERYLEARVHNATRTEPIKGGGGRGGGAGGSGARVFHGHEHRDLVRFDVFNDDEKEGANAKNGGPSSASSSCSLLALLDTIGAHTPLIPLLDYVARLEHVADAITASMYTEHVSEATRREHYLKGVMIRASRAEEQNTRLNARNEALVRENVTRAREIAQLKEDIAAMISAGVVHNVSSAQSVTRGGIISAVMSGSDTTKLIADAAGVRGMLEASTLTATTPMSCVVGGGGGGESGRASSARPPLKRLSTDVLRASAFFDLGENGSITASSITPTASTTPSFRNKSVVSAHGGGAVVIPAASPPPKSALRNSSIVAIPLPVGGGDGLVDTNASSLPFATNGSHSQQQQHIPLPPRSRNPHLAAQMAKNSQEEGTGVERGGGGVRGSIVSTTATTPQHRRLSRVGFAVTPSTSNANFDAPPLSTSTTTAAAFGIVSSSGGGARNSVVSANSIKPPLLTSSQRASLAAALPLSSSSPGSRASSFSESGVDAFEGGADDSLSEGEERGGGGGGGEVGAKVTGGLNTTDRKKSTARRDSSSANLQASCSVEYSPAEEHRTAINRWMDAYDRKRMQILDEIGL